eukprot:scaffold137591_cov36-Tisochrysis_lutea.AAC.1
MFQMRCRLWVVFLFDRALHGTTVDAVRSRPLATAPPVFGVDVRAGIAQLWPDVEGCPDLQSEPGESPPAWHIATLESRISPIARCVEAKRGDKSSGTKNGQPDQRVDWLDAFTHASGIKPTGVQRDPFAFDNLVAERLVNHQGQYAAAD